jgi:hypothetical protein
MPVVVFIFKLKLEYIYFIFFNNFCFKRKLVEATSNEDSFSSTESNAKILKGNMNEKRKKLVISVFDVFFFLSSFN